MITALELIIPLKTSTILKNIRQSSVKLSQIIFTSASLVICARLLTLKTNYLLIIYIKWNVIQIFICFTLKQSGVHLVTKKTHLIHEMLASMLITGKISVVKCTYITIAKTSVKTGAQKRKLKLILTAAILSTGVVIAMAGKSKSTTTQTIRLTSADQSAENALKLIVLTITMNQSADIQYPVITGSFHATVALLIARLRSTSQFIYQVCSKIQQRRNRLTI